MSITTWGWGGRGSLTTWGFGESLVAFSYLIQATYMYDTAYCWVLSRDYLDLIDRSTNDLIYRTVVDNITIRDYSLGDIEVRLRPDSEALSNRSVTDVYVRALPLTISSRSVDNSSISVRLKPEDLSARDWSIFVERLKSSDIDVRSDGWTNTCS